MHQIGRKLHRAYSSTRKATLNLVQKGVLTESGLMIIEHTKLETQTFDLTLKGVLLIIQKELTLHDSSKWNCSFLHRIIKKYTPMLPLIFGKWNHFDKMGVEKTAFLRLRAIVTQEDMYQRGDPRIPGKTMEEKINWAFYLGSFYPPIIFLPEDPVEWVNAWKEDGDINAFGITEIERHIKRYEDAITLYKKYLFYLKGFELDTSL